MQSRTLQASSSPVLVYGAAGHTARFVVAALRHRGHAVVLAGRDGARLTAAYPTQMADDFRVFDLGDTQALQLALRDVRAVVNCAGPFADTTPALVRAAVQAGAHYIDIAAEQMVALDVFEQWNAQAARRGVTVLPAVGFYGGLGDLLATAAMGDWPDAETINIGIALDSWHPTSGTRKTVARNAGRHLVYANHRLQPSPQQAPRRTWQFADAFGAQDMVGVSLADAVTISSHLKVGAINSFINETPINDLHDPATPAPKAADASGRSAQRFTVEAIVHRKGERRGASASGQDIYAITGPLVAEAVSRLGDGATSGVHAVGALFDPDDFLLSLSPELHYTRTDSA